MMSQTSVAVKRDKHNSWIAVMFGVWGGMSL